LTERTLDELDDLFGRIFLNQDRLCGSQAPLGFAATFIDDLG